MESIESEEPRYTIFPIKRWDVWKLYKKAQTLFWVEEEIDTELAKDKKDWDELDPNIQHFIQHVLAFFAVSDGVVNETLIEEILSRVQTREVRFWYDFQVAMEDIHNIVYSKLIDTYITSETEKQKLFNALEHYPSIKKKINWVKRWLGSHNELHKLSPHTRQTLLELEKIYRLVTDFQTSLNKTIDHNDPSTMPKNGLTQIELFNALHEPRPTLAKQIIINTIMEGIFFSGSFCAIYWVYHTHKKLPGLAKANEFISRDEGLHTEFGIHLYKTLAHKLPEREVFDIIDEAVEIESDFIKSALPQGLLGMNDKLMTQYIKFVADQLLQNLGYNKHYKLPNPFDFMNKQSTSVRIGDFFTDGNLSEYGHHASGSTTDDQSVDFSDPL